MCWLQSTCMEPFCLSWHLTAPQHFREDSHCTLSPLWQGITYSYWTYLWSFWQCSICFLNLVNFPVFLLWPGEKQTSLAQYIIVDIWKIFLQTRTRLLSENGYQITEIWWHTALFPTSIHPVYSEQIICSENRLLQLFLNFISLFNKLDCSSISRLVSMEYPGSEQIILRDAVENAEWIWRRNNLGEPNYNPLSVFLRSKFHMCIICIKRRKQPEKGRNK